MKGYLSDVLLLLSELAVVIIHLLIEALAPIHKVPRIDPDLLKTVCHHAGHHWLKMDVCYQWHIIPVTSPGTTHINCCSRMMLKDRLAVHDE